ncbi:acyl-CoA thioesterase [Actinomadura sp. NEAU-AAG7]|uniref:acyl-CoA thioesterase n=1 Tax=Actinomadura sp. NEAU-AAG7 TaxID=2839640 RepID=UPI0027DFA09A|nr:acyl-CoA thioesterase [Actinomadura sp. NEAU-AAG7]
MSAVPEPIVQYGHVEPTFVHFDDLDSMGIVHNSRYAVMLERALTNFWEQHGYSHSGGKPSHPDAFVAVVEYSIGYKVPVFGTGEILIHFWGDRIGKTSATYGFRVLSTDGKTVHAEGRRVHIRLDQESLTPTPWAAETLAIYETILPPEGSAA